MIHSLYPGGDRTLALTGAYLDLELHQAAAPGGITIFANFIASLDGRISMLHRQSGEYGVPPSIANQRDWRLYQELAAQSDVMITSARYFRQLAKGCAQDLLPVGAEPHYADLRAWRKQQGLKAQPDVAIISNSLDIPVEALAGLQDRRVLVITSAAADAGRSKQLKDQGCEMLVAGERRVEGGAVKQTLVAKGYRAGYMIAGPEVYRTLLGDGAVDYLFLTTRHTLLGGSEFHTMLEGDLPDGRACDMALVRLFYDQIGGQSFAQYRFTGSRDE